jgi:hypothetical protein
MGQTMKKGTLYSLQVKYEKEVCMCLEVAVVKIIDGTLEGVNAKQFNYLGKQIIAINKMKRKVNSENNRIRILKHGGVNWVIVKQITGIT